MPKIKSGNTAKIGSYKNFIGSVKLNGKICSNKIYKLFLFGLSIFVVLYLDGFKLFYMYSRI